MTTNAAIICMTDNAVTISMTDKRYDHMNGIDIAILVADKLWPYEQVHCTK